MRDLASFSADQQAEVRVIAEQDGEPRLLSDAYTEWMISLLAGAGYINDAEVASFQARGLAASAFSIDDDGATLNLFIADYQVGSIRSLPQSDLDRLVKRAFNFAKAASEGLHQNIEESSDAWDMSQQIAQAWENLTDLRITVITNATVKGTPRGTEELAGLAVTYQVWDLDRTYKFVTSGDMHEPISVDFENEFGGPLPALGPFVADGGLAVYVLTIPGDLLADIYAAFGPRLLESNVRAFLQARNKVNRGIQITLKEEPEKFLAYNNGISMTASKARTVKGPEGLLVVGVDDLQVVNGGQTTASLYYARTKNKVDLADVWVQAKLSVVDSAVETKELVKRISAYANSQNAIKMADFSANDPFHIEIEKLSRSIWAPGPDGSHHQTRWFYERARGQYADELARARTPAAQKQFKATHPLAQKFTKTDLAKFENVWDQKPATVCLGAEKNFRDFTIELTKRPKFTPDAAYFEKLVAKAILFRASEKAIGKLHLGGYRAQTVAYTLALLLNRTAQRIDLDRIWATQRLSDELLEAVETLAPMVHETLIASAGSRNVSEWAKKAGAWDAVEAIRWVPAEELQTQLLSTTRRADPSGASSVKEVLNDEEGAAMAAVLAVSGATWFELSKWAKETGSLQGWQRSLSFSLGKLANSEKRPSRKQAVQGAKILAEAGRLGFQVTPQ